MDCWRMNAGVPALSIYTTYFYNAFVIGVVLTAIYVPFLFWPPVSVDKSSLTQYLTDNNGRLLSCLSGVAASTGEGIQLMGGEPSIDLQLLHLLFIMP